MIAASVVGLRPGVRRANADINITPFVDVMLVLLIIFMVVTPTLLAGFEAQLPVGQNLKERPDDIPLLADYFMAHAASASGQPPRTISAAALAALQSYSWPGNVRELRNTIERLLIMAPDDPSEPIDLDNLAPEISADTPVAENLETNVEIMGLPLRDAREIFEREYLLAQVTRFGGNISRTAEFIGMERSALHRKLKSLGVRNEERQ